MYVRDEVCTWLAPAQQCLDVLPRLEPETLASLWHRVAIFVSVIKSVVIWIEFCCRCAPWGGLFSLQNGFVTSADPTQALGCLGGEGSI